MNQGLAAQVAPQSQNPPMQEPVAQAELPSVEQIAQALMKGISPEELLQAGIPRELIEQAMMLVQQAMEAQQGQTPPQQGGLAAMAGA